jgi:uncharacterized protein
MTAPVQHSSIDLQARLLAIIREDSALMALLSIVSSLGLADWCIAAGAVRNLVWDRLHGYRDRSLPADVDVLYFDARNTDSTQERLIELQLGALRPGLVWDAVNQAAVYAYTGDPEPYRSIEEAMSRWVDPVTAVGVSLGAGGSMRILAPHGLQDLFDMVVRPHLAAPNAAAIYRDRVARKNWQARWPKVQVIHLPPA